ncbi:MAG: prolipoprotein diacylglyceryl transferase [Prolixibacteraceae bacterium]|jgi:phosphatidylglycerol---prolipoprotein diacylglyceryl transferase|nr:prolipoprotein diacylglyceryl transferase [Prolixibacteraceae bacterium]MBT6005336.1 prolipoprotein diacylglyceryl transferase [Prolixibacteraceae bacterium]MBT6765819.1 prolipoprotein diacylglyceryl transferase [Prolixibacteraceae bacterium]MBT7000970.1 prolipoprotein diacylglyceryl transferase [Prolixibacteraceae bacterium]MBT7395057.1 prolipoprotein diacylglyceryl transferase [Prolixibacteraceae bacterium]
MINFLNFIHWNINPEIFSLGPLSIRWYGLLFASGFLTGYYVAERMLKSENVSEKWIDSLFFYLIIATILGARLGHVFFYGWEYYSQNPSEILKVWHGGLASHGGAIGIIVAMYIHSRVVTKRTILWTLDRIVIPTALAIGFIRLGNLMNSEIYGIETSLPWGFIFENNGETVAKHPTQIYEALAYLLTFGVLIFLFWKTKSKDKPGLFTGTFFILAFSARFLIEFIKEDQEAFEATMQLNMGQWLSVPFVLLGIFFVVRAIRRPEKVYTN